jgi:hypothetical protein
MDLPRKTREKKTCRRMDENESKTTEFGVQSEFLDGAARQIALSAELTPYTRRSMNLGLARGGAAARVLQQSCVNVDC